MKKSENAFSIKDLNREQKKTRESEVLFYEHLRSALAKKKKQCGTFYHLL